jgi:cytochrome c
MMKHMVSLALVASVFLGVHAAATAAEGNAEKGKAVFAKCGICHQVGPGAKTLVGPELNGIVRAQGC